VTLLLGVLAASLVGSIHCGAMCGGFVCIYARGTARTARGGASAHIAYNTGRLFSYVTLGLMAGAVGARVNRLAELVSIERGAAIVGGSLMIAWAVSILATKVGVRLPQLSAPVWIKQQLGGALVAMGEQPATMQAGAIGLLTTLLPCGWLYTFVVTAGGTASPIAGAAVMIAFWIGTVPMLAAVGIGARQIARPIARHLPVASAVVVLVLGALSVAGRLQPVGSPHTGASHAAHVIR
jgi:sulfite exporter TauE/SafE